MAFAFSMISFSEICRYERYEICPRLTNPLQNFCQREDAKEHNANETGVYKVDAEDDNLLSGHLLIEISKLIYSCLKADKFNTMYAMYGFIYYVWLYANKHFKQTFTMPHLSSSLTIPNCLKSKNVSLLNSK